MGFWDKYKDAESAGSVKFEHPLVVEGVLIQLGSTDFGGERADEVPVLYLQGKDGTVRDVACAQVNLLRQIVESAPDMGDHVTIDYQGEDMSRKKPGRNAPKMFEVTVTPKAMLAGNGAPAQRPGFQARAEADKRRQQPQPVPDDGDDDDDDFDEPF